MRIRQALGCALSGIPLVWLFFGAVLGVRLAILARYAVDIPFMDQWDNPLLVVFVPYFDGSLGLSHFLASHLEHRVVMTKLFDLAMLKAEGVWSTWPELLLDQLLMAISATAVAHLLSVRLSQRRRMWFFGVSALLFTTPFAWEAILWSFCSQMYFCIALAVLAAWGLIYHTPARVWFWVGFVAALAMNLAFGAGVQACLVLALVVIAQHGVFGHNRGGWLAGVLLLGAGLVAVVTMQHPTVHNVLLAHSVRQFLRSFGHVMSWPLNVLPWVATLPFMVMVVQQGRMAIATRTCPAPVYWFAAALGGWMMVFAASVAYARAGTIAARYCDFLSLACCVNLACLAMFRDAALEARARLMGWVLRVWSIALIFVLVRWWWHAKSLLAIKLEQSTAQVRNVADYLHSGQMSALLDKPDQFIPYPTGQPLAEAIDKAHQYHILGPWLYTGQVQTQWQPVLAIFCILMALACLLVLGWRSLQVCKDVADSPLREPPGYGDPALPRRMGQIEPFNLQ
jgi:hypothetical protein